MHDVNWRSSVLLAPGLLALPTRGIVGVEWRGGIFTTYVTAQRTIVGLRNRSEYSCRDRTHRRIRTLVRSLRMELDGRFYIPPSFSRRKICLSASYATVVLSLRRYLFRIFKPVFFSAFHSGSIQNSFLTLIYLASGIIHVRGRCYE